eukprot:TRINITY_DN114568_c0_g1_i1.p1 TRINITY_DN114568_c0_g1~~TRINITY_DN114568_c0_g1_i1.p1  ORF type:complete len:720 (-),score=133.37 TRINITY_DN114568_c0_g1_i1:191-2350(-)
MASKPAPETPLSRLRAIQRGTPANKKCANCRDPGPTYICLDFLTFVCQTCSGIHREFGHKIKGISLSEWNFGEVQRIEQGGNERNAKTMLGNVDSGEEPDASNLDGLRDFIRKAYVHKAWQCEAGASKTVVDSSTKPAPTATPAPKSGASNEKVDLVEASSKNADAPVDHGSPDKTIAVKQAADPGKAGKTGDQKFVPLQTKSACFCPDHDRSEKRPKQTPVMRPCVVCKLEYLTNYKNFEVCPGCSGKHSRCMICGVSADAEPAGVKEAAIKEATTAPTSKGYPTEAGGHQTANAGVPIIDLLDSGADLLGDSSSQTAAATEPAPEPLPADGGDGSAWTADFEGAFKSADAPDASATVDLGTDAVVAAPVQQAAPAAEDLLGGLGDVDFFSSPAPAPAAQSTEGSHAEQTDLLQTQGMSEESKGPQEAPAESPAQTGPTEDFLCDFLPPELRNVHHAAPQEAPTINSIASMKTLAPAKFESEDEKKAVAERLRAAVVNGSNDDITNLFKECTEPAHKAAPARSPTACDRFAVLMDEDSLNSLLVEPAPASDERTESQEEASQAATPPEVVPTNPSLPTDTQRASVVAALVPTDSIQESHPTAFADFAAAQPVTQQVQASPCPAAGMASISPQQLLQMDQTQLFQMQAMISQALQQQAGGQPGVAMPSASPVAAAAPAPSAGAAPAATAAADNAQFGDLVSLFNDKKLVATTNAPSLMD